tara:strand:+ start:17 stop:2380 length:2364 start_codon:yes stop_codon:yes gene_type:complete
MSEIQKKFSELTVYNSVTNNITPEQKYDLTNPFSFVEFLNYIKLIDDDNTKNYELFKQYLKQWELNDKKVNKNPEISLRGFYINFFSELLLVYGNSEEKRYFSNLDLNNEESLTNAIPFFTRKINEIVNYYREKRNTFKKDLREYKNKGSVNSVENFTKHTILNFIENGINDVSLIEPLSSIQQNLKIELEEGYDTYNDYYDIDPTDETQSSNANDIPSTTFLNLDAAIAETITENGIYIEEILPFKLTVKFDTPEEQYLQSEDYIDYNINLKLNSDGDVENITPRDTLKILYEAELSQKLTGTDYYYLSATSEGIALSGKLFTADNEIENALNINFPSSSIQSSGDTEFDRQFGLFYKPTNFSILRVDGSYFAKLKTDIEPGLYVYPDPDNYGDIVGTSTRIRKNPYNFFFDQSSYKNASSSSGRNTVKSNKRSHYFHSYTSHQQNRSSNVNTNESFNNRYTDVVDFGTIRKVDSDIYGNEFIVYVKDPSAIKNIDTEIGRYFEPSPFKSGETLYTTKNRYGEVVSSADVIDVKNIYINNVKDGTFLPLSASKFVTIIDKYKSNSKLYGELIDSILDINLYDDTFSIKTLSYNVIDKYIFDGEFKSSTLAPMVMERDDIFSNFSHITNDLKVGNDIIKCNISLVPSFSSYNNCFYYEFYVYNLNKNRPNVVVDRRVVNLDYYEDLTKFDIDVKLMSLNSANLSYNSKQDQYNLVINYNDYNKNIYIHTLNFKLKNNGIEIVRNYLYRPVNYNHTSNLYDITSLQEYTTIPITTTPSINIIQGSINF